MRKFNIKKIPQNYRVVSEPATSEIARKYSQSNTPLLNRFDYLKNFQDELDHRQRLLLSNPRKSRRSLKSCDQTNYSQKKSSYDYTMKQATQEVQQLKKQLQHQQKLVQQTKVYTKLEKFIDTLEVSLEQQKYAKFQQSSQPTQPVFYPMPMPFPMYNNPPPPQPHSLGYTKRPNHQNTRSTFKSKNTSFFQENKYRSRISKTHRLKRNLSKWKRAVHAILFTIYLRNFCKKIRQSRKLVFVKLEPSLPSALKMINEDFKNLLRPFFTLLFTKRDVQFDIDEGQNRSLATQKVNSIRKLIGMILGAVKKWVDHAASNEKYSSVLYHLCRHGNYSCTEPILTQDELELTCISVKNGYVSADRNLETAAIINFIFMKLLLYNILLSPQKISVNFQEDTLAENLHIIASVLYELAIDIQDEYMLLVPKSYKVGNFQSVNGVQVAQPLVCKRAVKQQGQIISGLRSEEWVRKYFKFQSWASERLAFKGILGVAHGAICGLHKSISARFF